MAAQVHDKLDKTDANLNLAGLRVLIVEDEPLIAMFLEQALTDIGCATVGVANSLDEAAEKSAELTYDFVTLDVHLAGQQTFKFAKLLSQQLTPFIFCTGYGNIIAPPQLQHVPLLQKPFTELELRDKITLALTLKNQN